MRFLRLCIYPCCIHMSAMLLSFLATASATGGYRCDVEGGARGVCIKGEGNFSDATCDGKCPSFFPQKFHCTSDWSCSLAGVCDDGKCKCDAWSSGIDCSYLNFQPLDPFQIGYLDEHQSSWGGNAVLGEDKKWHLYMAEIACAEGSSQTRCGLGGWQSNSQVAHATAPHPAGPYTRQELVLPREHHNPTLKVSPVDGSWNLYSISRGSGPIVTSSSSDQGKTWTDAKPGAVVSDEQNPGPVLYKNGSMTMFYRDNSRLPGQTCSDESIGVQYCSSRNASCSGGRNPVFGHTAEDPSVFQDTRGNWHMLVNALPGGCQPKVQQGGHAWSRDGISWSEPRTGAYNTTMLLTNGSSITCGRRERPQMILDPGTGVPLAMTAGVTGCPAFGFNKGEGDSFTVVQMMVQ